MRLLRWLEHRGGMQRRLACAEKEVPPANFPAERAEITLNVKGAKLTLKYEDTKSGTRTTTIEGAEYTEEFDTLMNTTVYYLPAEKMGKEITITIKD